MFPWVIFFTVFCGGPLVVEALGNCPVYRPLNTALTGRAGQGRLNQWAHWTRAQGPRLFSFLRGPNWLW